MTLPSKVYDTLKWVLTIVVPAFVTLYLGINGLLVQNGLAGLPYPEVVTGIATLIATFVGSLFMISSSNYNAVDSAE